METRTKNKTATVCKDQTGYWAAFAHDTGERLGGLHSTELDASETRAAQESDCRPEAERIL